MQSKYAKIKFQLYHDGKVNPDVIKSILQHLEHDKMFALAGDDEDDAFVFFPKDMTVRHTGGEVFVYKTPEEFFDSISETLHSYKGFFSQLKPVKNG